MFRPFTSSSTPSSSFSSPPTNSSAGTLGGGSTLGSSSGFGQSAPGSSLFGSTGMATSSATAVPAFSHPHTPYQSTKDVDNGMPIIIHAISAMANYAGESFEEIRYKDYAFGRKGRTSLFPASAAPAPLPSGSPAPPSSGLFGTSTGTFGNQPSGMSTMSGTSMFGQPAASSSSTSLFGPTGPTTFGTHAAPTFGSSTTVQSFGQPTSSSSLFGATPSFGGGSSAFGSNAPSAASGFIGASPYSAAAGQSNAPSFGSSSGFGSQTQSTSTNLYGPSSSSSTQGLFGQPSGPASSATMGTSGVSPFGGQSIFSGSTTQSFGTPSSAFGQQPQQQQSMQPKSSPFGTSAPLSSTFGTGAPSSASTGLFSKPSAFGTSVPSMFGSTAPSSMTMPSAPSFGMPQQTSTGFGSTGFFGASSQQPPPQQQPSQPTATGAAPAFSFAPSMAPTEAKPFSFGSAPASTQPSAFSFGQTQPSATSAFSFGAQAKEAPATSAFTFGGPTASTSGGLFGAKPASSSSFSFGQPSTQPMSLFKPPAALPQINSATALPLIAPPPELMSIAPPVPLTLRTSYVPPPLELKKTPAEASQRRESPRTPVLSMPKITGSLQPKPASKSDIKKLVITVSLEDTMAAAASPDVAPEPPRIGDFYMQPSEQQLNKMGLEQLKVVDNFVVGQRGLGEIQFLRPVDLSTINLNDLFTKIVRFEPKQVSVYPEADEDRGAEGCKAPKPPPGQGLNQPARVKLERCWPMARGTRTPITDADSERMHQHIERLRAVPDTKFISFDVRTGTWIFEVEHFSRYAMPSNDDDHSATSMSPARQIILDYLQSPNRQQVKMRPCVAFVHSSHLATSRGTDVVIRAIEEPVMCESPVQVHLLLGALQRDRLSSLQEWLFNQLGRHSTNQLLSFLLSGRFAEAVDRCPEADLAAVIASFQCLRADFDFAIVRQQLVEFRCRREANRNLPAWEAMGANEAAFEGDPLMLFALRFNILSSDVDDMRERLGTAMLGLEDVDALWALAINYKLTPNDQLAKRLVAKLGSVQVRLAVAEQFFPQHQELGSFLRGQLSHQAPKPIMPVIGQSEMGPSERLHKLQLMFAL